MDHKKLDAWKYAIVTAKEIYRFTMKLPREEKFGISAQLRRAAVSVPSNLAEGSARCSDQEFIRYLRIAFGSAAEIETQLILCEEIWGSRLKVSLRRLTDSKS